MLIYIRDKLKRGGKASFSKVELSQLLSVYGVRVQRGEWRDYAIDSMMDRAVFSIFKSSKELPVYSVTKIVSRSVKNPSQYTLDSAGKILKQSTSLLEIVEHLGEL